MIRLTDRTSELSKLLIDGKKKLSIAESCTGGNVASEIVSRPGSSKYFLGSAVTYSNESKETILNVKRETMIKFGAVSRETAEEMAIGCRNAYQSDIAASVTGIAGPDGGSAEKPVGTVWISVTDGEKTVSIKKQINGSRKEIIVKATAEVMASICDFLRGSV